MAAECLRAVESSLHLETAARIVDEAIAVRRKANLLPLAVAVLDAGGNLVAFKREDGCGVLRFDIARGKAWAVPCSSKPPASPTFAPGSSVGMGL